MLIKRVLSLMTIIAIIAIMTIIGKIEVFQCYPNAGEEAFTQIFRFLSAEIFSKIFIRSTLVILDNYMNIHF